jgi:hypothetical protein
LELIRQWFSFWTQVPEVGQQLAAPIAKQPVSQLDSLNRPTAVTKSQPITPQLVAQIPWGHNILIIQKLSDPKDAFFTSKERSKTIGRAWLSKVGIANTPEYSAVMSLDDRTSPRHLKQFVKLGLARKVGDGKAIKYETN